MKELTPTKAQAYLAEQLRERIEVLDPTGTPTYYILQPHKRQHHLVDEFDWDYIAHEVEGKMTAAQHFKYRVELYKLTDEGDEDEWHRDYCSATYTQRATAMKESGLKP